MEIGEQGAVKGCARVQRLKAYLHASAELFHVLDVAREIREVSIAAVVAFEFQNFAGLQVSEFDQSPEREFGFHRVENLEEDDFAALMLKMAQALDERLVRVEEI